MKTLITITLLACLTYMAMAQSSQQSIDSLKTLNLEEVFVNSTRANDKTPFTFTDVKKETIKAVNLGQDLPILLKMTPSLVTTSDAGAGIGYTGMRIRGSDATRINVTINGIPLNDSESQGVFWVNIPDFSSTTSSVQIQRGVGTSTNGAAAFGATVNLQTNTLAREAYGINNSIGSYGTRKHTIMLNSGLIDNRWAFEGRLSKITSDGYIDRASSDLQSYYLSGLYYGKKTIVKALAFGGQEETYQAWNGVFQDDLANNRQNNSAGIYHDKNGELQFYDNEIDHYQQNHYQLHLSHQLNENWDATLAGHYTHGRGYFEQYKEDEDLVKDYGFSPIQIGLESITESDIIRRRWLDNDFLGFTYSINYERDKASATLGGGYNYYDGDHFGEVIWAQYAGDINIRARYYDNIGIKNDFNSFLKINHQLTNKLNLYADAQIRIIQYATKGIDSDLRTYDINNSFTFFNPKIGATYKVSSSSSIYGSYGIGNKEPTRGDFLDSNVEPKHETLHDIEIGYKRVEKNYQFNVNLYNMNYDNQLVLTGELDDVGNSVRANVKDSYRRGLEFEALYQFSSKFSWGFNTTISQNKIDQFVELSYDYGVNWDEFNIIENKITNTDISFSPNIIVGSVLSFTPVENLSLGIQSKYVGKQFLDNTSNNQRNIEGYFINDLNIGYSVKTAFIKEIGFQLLVNNLLDVSYESNGYTFGYLGGGETIRENYYYPQAGRNFLFAINLKF